MADRRRDAMRRYPAFGFVALAVALASTLPTALTLPQDAPSELAELAPVPPEEEAPPQQGDVGSLGSASSTGLGSGVGGDGAPPPPPPPPPPADGDPVGPGQRELALKRCVGDPPRQTEDPLAPPCVAFFDGDNGGDTAQGVTRDEVVVAIVGQGGANHPDGTWTDLSEPPDPDDGPAEQMLRVYARYFNDRYQTYGRHVRLVEYHATAGATDEAAQARADAIAVAEGPPGLGPPFAAVLQVGSLVAQDVLAAAIAERGIVTFTHDGQDRADQARVTPYWWSFEPDHQDRIALTGSYACRKLVGRPPVHASGLTGTADERVFGILYSDSEAEPVWRRMKDLLVADLAARCGVDEVPTAAVATTEDLPGAMGQLQAAGVTTAIPFLHSGMRTTATRIAGGHPWDPEWLIPADWNMVETPNARGYDQGEWSRAFGVSPRFRRGLPDEQPYRVAHRDACPSCPPPSAQAGEDAYESLFLLFRAIQAAGPRLAVDNLERGLRAIPAARSDDPFLPAAYFRPGNWSFIKDGMDVWWDPTAQPEGTDRPGCYRMVADGLRYRAGEWPEEDRAFATQPATPPCQIPLN